MVLGIAPTAHPLCHGNTFQVLDGSTRLYSMPFRVDPAAQTFWQLSFRCDEGVAERLRFALAHLLTPNAPLSRGRD